MTKVIHKSMSLHQAALDGDFAVCRLLLKSGVDVNRKNRRGGTALHYVARRKNDNYQIASLLPKNGADPNAIYGVRKRRVGNTALHIAVLHEDVRLVRLLLRNGASIRIRDNDGMTAIAWAHYLGFNNVCKVFGKSPKTICVPKFLR